MSATTNRFSQTSLLSWTISTASSLPFPSNQIHFRHLSCSSLTFGVSSEPPKCVVVGPEIKYLNIVFILVLLFPKANSSSNSGVTHVGLQQHGSQNKGISIRGTDRR